MTTPAARPPAGLGETSVCARCGTVYWTANGHSCRTYVTTVPVRGFGDVLQRVTVTAAPGRVTENVRAANGVTG